MTTHRGIVKALWRAAGDSESVVLATVVRVSGSSYGGVGARMVVRVDGTTVGVVSGGCLETDLAERARSAHAAGRAVVVTYDTRADDDAAWGLGLGCNGLIDVLLEPLRPVDAAAFARLLEQGLAADARCVLATVISAEAPNPGAIGDISRINAVAANTSMDNVAAAVELPDVGAHALFEGETIETTGNWGDRSLLKLALADVNTAIEAGRRGAVCDYGKAAIAFETVTPAIRLIVCGSGPDTLPLARLAHELGWDLTIVDHRPVEHAQLERFPDALVVECADPSRLAEAVVLTPRCGAVVMSHHFERDLEYVHALLGSTAGYIGVLGPRARTEHMLSELALRYGAPTGADARLFGPVGLDIGGDGPEAIALSIVGEVASVLNQRGAGHLKNRRAPLHEDTSPARVSVDG